ncbi:MAG: hypothetical protein U0W24_10600 [Bacteroidales bacterium]
MKNYLKRTFAMATIVMFAFYMNAQKNNIQISEIPADVKELLGKYLEILSSGKSVEEVANTLYSEGIIGGGLLNTSATGPSDDIIRFSLKKDFDNVKFYDVPPVITGVTFTADTYDGYQNTLIKGDLYKIWVKKKNGVNGRPAPIPVLKPKNGKPVVVSVIGSL